MELAQELGGVCVFDKWSVDLAEELRDTMQQRGVDIHNVFGALHASGGYFMQLGGIPAHRAIQISVTALRTIYSIAEDEEWSAPIGPHRKWIGNWSQKESMDLMAELTAWWVERYNYSLVPRDWTFATRIAGQCMRLHGIPAYTTMPMAVSILCAIYEVQVGDRGLVSVKEEADQVVVSWFPY